MIENFIKDYEVWVHFITATILFLIVIYFAWSYIVNTITATVDNSKYSYMIIRWILAKHDKEMTPEMEKKFITKKDMDVINNIQYFLNTVEMVGTRDCKYKEIEHPFFVWHDVVFCRTDGNDVVKIDDGKMGKISDDEEIKEIVISENFTKVLCAVDICNKIREHIKDI